MMISEQYRAVFLSMPKAGTHSMYYFLNEAYKFVRYAKRGPTVDLSANPYHWYVIPDEFKAFMRFTTCRNPFARAVGAWWTTRGGEMGAPAEFKDHVRWAITARPGYGAFQKQSYYLDLCEPGYILRCESLDADFAVLPFCNGATPEIPRVHSFAHERQPWPLYYDHATADVVREYYAEDFERLGYSTELDYELAETVI